MSYVSVSRILCVEHGKGRRYRLWKIGKWSDVDVLEYGCLQNCGMCSSGLYVLVDGDIVEGDSPDDLLNNIYKHIEENDITNMF